MTDKPRNGDRVPDRDEYTTRLNDPDAGEQELQAVLCQQRRVSGRAEGNPDLRCTREAKVRRYGRALCEEHARDSDLWETQEYWSLAEAIADDWLRMAQAWEHEDLVALAGELIDQVRSEYAAARVLHREALEWADRVMVPYEEPKAAVAVSTEGRPRPRREVGAASAMHAHLALEDALERLRQIPPATFEGDKEKERIERLVAEADDVVAREARRLNPPIGARSPEGEKS